MKLKPLDLVITSGLKYPNIGRASTPEKTGFNEQFVLERQRDFCPGRKSLIIDTINKAHLYIIGFRETKKEHISDSYLRSVATGHDFYWNSFPTKAFVGGIVVGIDTNIFDAVA